MSAAVAVVQTIAGVMTPRQLDNACVLTYGKSGSGKTADALYSFPNALFIAPPGALKAARTLCGYEPTTLKDRGGNYYEVQSVEELTGILPRVRSKGHDTVVVDDFSLLVERQLQILDKTHANWALWNAMGRVLLNFRDTGRRCGVHLIVNMHEQQPSAKDGKDVSGGPAVPGKLVEKLPTTFDVVLRVQSLTENIKRLGPWRGAYRNRVDGDMAPWITKDRHNIAPDWSPMNLGEILRAAGYAVSRLSTIASWQEPLVEKIACKLVAPPQGFTAEMILQQGADAARREMVRQGTVSELYVTWTLRDAHDRALLCVARKRAQTSFGVK